MDNHKLLRLFLFEMNIDFGNFGALAVSSSAINLLN